MKTFVHCGQLFTGQEDDARTGAILVFDETGVIEHVGPDAALPRRAPGDRVIDCSGLFVLPGLIDLHTHLAYGNAKSEEDIDLYSPLEFRSLRGMFFAQKLAPRVSPRSAHRVMPARSAFRSAMPSAPVFLTGRGSWPPGVT